MNKYRVLVTGASGYIGRHVVKILLDMGHEVLASDLQFNGVDERARQISVPIFSGNQDIFNQLDQPDICIHLAWKDGFKHNSYAHISELSQHFAFIKNMLQGGLAHIVVMGTMHEIGYWEGPIDEDTPANPLSFYGIAKNCLRQSTAILAQETNTIYQWLRAYYIIGDDIKNHSIFSKIAQLEAEGNTVFPFNSGKNKYDFIHVEELARQIAIAATQNEVNGIINCCTGNPISLADKVEEFIEQNNFKIRPKYGQFPDRPYDSPAVWGDNKKISMIIKNYIREVNV